MTANARNGERSVFLEALERDTPEKRDVYLATVCGADVGLRQRVEALLRSHEESAGLFGKPAPERIAEQLATVHAACDRSGGSPFTGHGESGLDFLTASDKPGSLGRLGSYEV